MSWLTSKKGNPYINIGDYNLVVFHRGKGFGYRTQNKNPNYDLCTVSPYKKIYTTENEAKEAGLQSVERLQALCAA